MIRNQSLCEGGYFPVCQVMIHRVQELNSATGREVSPTVYSDVLAISAAFCQLKFFWKSATLTKQS